MLFGRVSWRWQLAAWNTVVVLAFGLTLLYAVRSAIVRYLTEDIEITLEQEAVELVQTIIELYPDEEAIIAAMQRKIDSHNQLQWHARWLDETHQNILWASARSPVGLITERVEQRFGRTMVVRHGFRSIEVRVNHQRVPKYYVQIGMPTEFVDLRINALTVEFLAIGILFVIVSPIGGLWLASWATRPLQNILKQTDRLDPRRLTSRLPVRGVNDELDQLAQKINAFVDRIANFVKVNRDFLADSAHELRSPLTAIQSMIDVALEHERSEDEYAQLLERIGSECSHLTKLVNQLLDLAASERPTTDDHRETFVFNDMISRASEIYSAVAEENGVRLTVVEQESVTLHADSQRIRQLVTNLIDNAIKFTPSGGEITLSIGRLANPNRLLFTVKDTGNGIPKEEVEYVFQRFYQVEKSRGRGEKRRGTGLGLCICEAIVKGHGGKIWMESDVGKGTSVFVELPSVAASGSRPS